MGSQSIINMKDLESFEFGHGENFKVTMGRVSPLLGLSKIGCNVSEYPPGKAGFPQHAHRVNDELFFVLAGQGELRLGRERLPIVEGDFVGLPASSGKAHQVTNTGDTPLKLLALSSTESPDVVEYPEQGKLSVAIFDSTKPLAEAVTLRKIFRVEDEVEYWDGVED